MTHTLVQAQPDRRACAPGARGPAVARVDAMPFASVRRMQVAAPQTANWTAPAVVVKVTVSPTTGVTPSACKTWTANGTVACCPTISAPAGAVSRLNVVAG